MSPHPPPSMILITPSASGDSSRLATPPMEGCQPFHTLSVASPYVASAHDLQRDARGSDMKRKSEVSSDDLRREYTFIIRRPFGGKYYRRLIREVANVVVLEQGFSLHNHQNL